MVKCNMIRVNMAIRWNTFCVPRVWDKNNIGGVTTLFCSRVYPWWRRLGYGQYHGLYGLCLSPWLHRHHSIHIFIWRTRLAVTWWRNQMETFSALLAIFPGNSPVRWILHTKASDAELWCSLDLRLNLWHTCTWVTAELTELNYCTRFS